MQFSRVWILLIFQFLIVFSSKSLALQPIASKSMLLELIPWKRVFSERSPSDNVHAEAIPIKTMTAQKKSLASHPSNFFLNNLKSQDLSIASDYLKFTADFIKYDNRHNLIIMKGNVEVYYAKNLLKAHELTYNCKTKHVLASGNVVLTRPDGTVIHSNRIRLMQDLGTGFIDYLKIKTPKNGYFSATKVEQTTDGNLVFNNATYTNCPICNTPKNQKLLWEIKAEKIIWNKLRKRIYFDAGSFNFYGIPIFYWPLFSIPDSNTQKKSEILAPHASYNKYLGYGVGEEFLWQIDRNNDLRFSENFYSKQGFLNKILWTHRFLSGTYNLFLAAIHQLNPYKFEPDTISYGQKNRFFLGSNGSFQITPFWNYGWDLSCTSDKSFARTYALRGYNQWMHVSNIYLHGLVASGHLDLEFYTFKNQLEKLSLKVKSLNIKQPMVLPTLDFERIFPNFFYDGTAIINMDLRLLHWLEPVNINKESLPRLPDKIKDTSFRFGGNFDWKKLYISPSGIIFTSNFGARGDFFYQNNQSFHSMDSYFFRYIGIGGMDVRWPFLLRTKQTRSILEPIFQLNIRNNELRSKKMPNDDSEIFVLKPENLFSPSKFSGFDRVEGGTRSNIGISYKITDNKHWEGSLLIGQSFQLDGNNSYKNIFKNPIERYSGLESNRSDIVVGLNFSHQNDLCLMLNSLFDKKTFLMNRTEFLLQKESSNFSFGIKFLYVKPNPTPNLHEITFYSNQNLIKNKLFLNETLSYDFSSNLFSSKAIGLSYHHDCMDLTIGYAQKYQYYDSKPYNQFTFKVNFLTLNH